MPTKNLSLFFIVIPGEVHFENNSIEPNLRSLFSGVILERGNH